MKRKDWDQDEDVGSVQVVQVELFPIEIGSNLREHVEEPH